MKTWVQVMRSKTGEFEEYNDSNSHWRYPKRTYRLYLGYYRQTMRQLTVIVDGGNYDYAKEYDKLGEQLGSGTLQEMLELLKTYKHML